MTSNNTKPAAVDMKLEVVLLRVSDVDRAKAFYENLGWRVDIDIAGGNFRGVQVTPHNSEASIIFGKGTNLAKPGSANLVLAVDNIDAARAYLVGRGVDVSEVFHYAAGPFNDTVENSRVGGRDPEGRSYFSFASFEDPDGNSWLLQEITARLPGREWQSPTTDVAGLAELLRETSEHHDPYEKSHGKHQWWDWYAPYLSARQNGSSPEEAAAAASSYMEKLTR
ncbi:MAG TPA: VOC family protein [Pyrinomonadaceae bacterium]|nr:VOC family protein [Pyrinomonadaceae bacterium]